MSPWREGNQLQHLEMAVVKAFKEIVVISIMLLLLLEFGLLDPNISIVQ